MPWEGDTMTVQPGWPAVSGAATFQDIRRAFAGLIVKNTAGQHRAGFLPVNPSAPIIAPASGWVSNVAAGVFVLDRNGAVLLPNVGVQPVTISSAPTSGTRWSVFYAKQRETDAPFADSVNGPLIDKVESTNSLNSALALLPAGALYVGHIQVNAGATSITDSSKVFITEVVPYTALEGGTVLLRNQTEQDAWSPHDGSEAYRLDLAVMMRRVGGVWYRVAFTQTARLTPGGVGLTASTMTTVASMTLPADAPPGTYLVMYTVTTSAGSAVAHYQLVQWAGVEITASPSDYMNAVPVGDASKSDTITKTGHPGGAATIDLRVQVNGGSASCRFARLTVLYVG